jgi:hypothetical protein
VISRRNEEPSASARAFLALLSRMTTDVESLERNGLRPLATGR